MTRSFLISVAFALFVVGCEKKPAPEAAASSTPTPPPAATPAATAATAAVADDLLSTEEDFEEEAEREITVKNIEAELDKLEKEIQ